MGERILADCCEGALLCLLGREKELEDRWEPWVEDKDDLRSLMEGNGWDRTGMVVAMMAASQVTSRGQDYACAYTNASTSLGALSVERGEDG